MKKIISGLLVFLLLAVNSVALVEARISTAVGKNAVVTSGISSTILNDLIKKGGLTRNGLEYIIEIKDISKKELSVLISGTSSQKISVFNKFSNGGLTSLQIDYLKNNGGLTSKGLLIISGTNLEKSTDFVRKVNNSGVYQVSFKDITSSNAGKTLETWIGKENFPTKILLKKGMSLDLDEADLDKQFVKTNTLKQKAAALKRQNIDFGKLDLKEPEIRLLPDRLQIVQKSTIEFNSNTQLLNIKKHLDNDENSSMSDMYSDLDNNLPEGASKTFNRLASTSGLEQDELPDDIDGEILEGLKEECKTINGFSSTKCSDEKIKSDFDSSMKSLESEEIISFSLIPPTAEQVRSGDLPIKQDPSEVRMTLDEINENFDEYGLINQEVIENSDNDSSESLYNQTNPFDDPDFCANQHGEGAEEYDNCVSLMESRNNPKEKEYNNTLLNGFTVGKADSYEWKKTLKVDLWVKTIKIFEVKFGFYYSYGFGIRIPIKTKVIVNKDVADNWNNENSKYSFDVSAETFNAQKADYSEMGISDSKLFNGKEFVFEFKAGFTYKIRAFRNVVNIDGKVSIFDILIAILGKDEIMNSFGISEEEYNKLVENGGIDKSLDFVPPFDGAANISLAKFGVPVPIIDWAYFRLLGFIGTEVLLNGKISAECSMLNSNGGCNDQKINLKRSAKTYNANAIFDDSTELSDELGYYSNYGPIFDDFKYYPELIFRIFAKAGASVKIPVYGWKTVRSPEITIYEMKISSDNLYLGTHDGTDGKVVATDQKIYTTTPNIVLNLPKIDISTHNNASKLELENSINPGTWYVYTLDGSTPDCMTSNRYDEAFVIWPKAYLEPVASKQFIVSVQGCSAYGDKTDILKNTINLENQSFNLSVYSDPKLNGYFKFMSTNFPGNKIAYTFDGSKAKCENPSTQTYISIENLHLTDTLSPTYNVPINAISCNEDNEFIESKRFSRVYNIANTLYNPFPSLDIASSSVYASYYPESGYKTYIKYKLSGNKITSVSGNDYISCMGEWGDGLTLQDIGEESDYEISGLTDYSGTIVTSWKNEETGRIGGTFPAHLGAKTMFAKTCIRDNSGELVFESDVKIGNLEEIRDGTEIFDEGDMGIHDAFLDSLRKDGLDAFLGKDGMLDFLETHGGLTAGGARELGGLMSNGGLSIEGLNSLAGAMDPSKGLAAGQKRTILNRGLNTGALTGQGLREVTSLIGNGRLSVNGLVSLNNIVQDPNFFAGYSPSPMNSIPPQTPSPINNLPGQSTLPIFPGNGSGIGGGSLPGGIGLYNPSLTQPLVELESKDEYVSDKLDEIAECLKKSYESHIKNIDDTIKTFEQSKSNVNDEKSKNNYQKAINKLEEVKKIYQNRYKVINQY